MNVDTKESIDNLMVQLDNPVIEAEVEVVQSRSQSEMLRTSTFNFLQNEMKSITQYKIVIQNALNSLNERILHKELDAKDTLTAINSLTNLVTNKTDVLLQPFKAAPQSSSPLLAPPKETEDNSFQKGINEMSAQDLQLLDSFIRKVASIKSEQAT